MKLCFYQTYFDLYQGYCKEAHFIRALDRILREYAGKSIVIVGHGGIVNASFIYFLGLTMFKYPPIVLNTRNTALTHWCQGPFEGYGRAEPQWFLERFNGYRHLEDEQEKSFPLA